MHDTLTNQFIQDGYLVLEDFLRPAECEELQAAGLELTKNQPDTDHPVISTSPPFKHHEKGSHFLDSGHKISYFYDSETLCPEGKLKVEPDKDLYKVGHALHLLHPIFRCYTFSDRVKAVCQQLGLMEPAVVQSVYSYKNSGVGTEVAAHQDSTYIFTEPVPVVSFWIALDDATVQNGCPWIARGSHKSGVHRRLIRNPDKDSKEALIYDRPFPMYPQSSFSAVPVNKGTCIVLHGNVVHKSGYNKSGASLNTYTFYVMEKHNNNYNEDNWLAERSDSPFLPVYTSTQII